MISLTDKLRLIVFLGAVLASAVALSLCSTPGRGYMRVVEKTAAGAALCFAFSLLFKPLGIEIAQSPLSALAAGLWGLPGLAISAMWSLP